jgi:hypothetical protein
VAPKPAKEDIEKRLADEVERAKLRLADGSGTLEEYEAALRAFSHFVVSDEPFLRKPRQ